MFGTSLQSHKRKTDKSAASDEYIPGIRKKTRRRSLLIISKSGKNTGLQVTDRVTLFNLRDNIRRGRRWVAIFFQSGYRQRSLIKDDNWKIMPMLSTWWPKMNTHSSTCGLNDFKGCSRSTSNGWHRNDGAWGDRLRSRNWNFIHLIDNENWVITPILPIQWAKLTLTVALVAWVAAWAGGISGARYRSFLRISEGLGFLRLAKLLQNALHIVRGVVCGVVREVDYLSALILFPIQATVNTQSLKPSTRILIFFQGWYVKNLVYSVFKLTLGLALVCYLAPPFSHRHCPQIQFFFPDWVLPLFPLWPPLLRLAVPDSHWWPALNVDRLHPMDVVTHASYTLWRDIKAWVMSIYAKLSRKAGKQERDRGPERVSDVAVK